MEKLHQDYTTIKDWWFYDLQNVLESYSNIIEKRNEEEQKQAKAQGYDPKQATPKGVMDSAKGMMPKTPSMPSLKFPKL